MTRRLAGEPAGIAEAASIVRAGGLVAFPTETVYGLGANALDAAAVRRIFEAKGRPADDPLIVHVPSLAAVDRVAGLSVLAQRLGERFWPGPLTLVLPRRAAVPSEVTAGLGTVAVRVPAHPLAHALLLQADLPIAAPSANLFSRPSPTRAEHVLDDLGGRIDAVLDGGPTPLGVESTIVDLSQMPPRLLRPGGLPAEELEAALGTTLAVARPRAEGPQLAPGQLPIHYAPRTPLVFIIGDPSRARARLRAELDDALARNSRVGLLALEDDRDLVPAGVACELVGAWSDPPASAARLFEALRALDRQGLDTLFARELADGTSGFGRALADRLRRAAARVIEV